MARLVKYFLAVIFAGFTGFAFSQNEAKKWYFGQYCALDFATNPPTDLANGAMPTAEGCASIADASGNLLFYTDGVSIWNQLHAVMANGTGLLGNSEITQSALIVKQPGSTSVYFVFTNDGALHYSVVDMSLAAGMGSVTIKNTLVDASTTQRLCGAKHCNSTDTWVISHDGGTDVFRAHLVTAAGLNATPVLSSAGTPYYGSNSTGCMKVSPNGKKIGTSLYNSAAFELYDFNNATGAVSNALTLPAGASAFGCEFSPDATKFYGTCVGALYQWDICAGSDQAVAASAYSAGVIPTGRPGQLQLAPDGKIYQARAYDKHVKVGETYVYLVYGEGMLGVIHNPNASAGSFNYNNTGQAVTPSMSLFGLPNFVSGFYKTEVAQFTYTVNPAISCVKAFFTAPPLVNATCSATSYTISSVKWLFDDPASGGANTSVLVSPSHTYPVNGTYNVRLILYSACGGVIDTLKQQVIVGGALLNSAAEFSVCSGQSLTLTAAGSSNYMWSTGATSSSIVVTPTATTTYTVSNTDAYGCLRSSVQTVTVNPSPPLLVTGSKTVCAGYSFTLTASGAVTYSWNNGSTNSSIFVTPTVTTSYTVTGTSFNACSITTVVTIGINPAPLPTITGNTVVCNGSAAAVVAHSSVNGTYVWSNGTQGATLTVAPVYTLHIFSVKVTYDNGCVRAKGVVFTVKYVPTIKVAGATTLCAGSAVTQTASGATSYSWSNGVTTNPAHLSPPVSTVYTVTNTDTNICTGTTTVLITVKPSTVSVNSATLCSGTTTLLEASSQLSTGVTYTWLPDGNSGRAIRVGAVNQVYTVTANLDGCIGSATGSVTAVATPSLLADNDLKLLPGASATLHVSGGATYTWDPSTYLSCSNCDAPVATPVESTRYCVRSAVGDCISEACIQVTVSCESDHDYSVPNAFTPNGDNTNDAFCLQGWEDCITEFNVMIFDRWGEKVYESGAPSFCWDGVYKGQLLNSGVFIYVIKAKKFNSPAPILRKGNISLIR